MAVKTDSRDTELAILKALAEGEGPMGASQVAAALLMVGMDLQPRTVRFYLLRLDGRGLTRLVSRRRGREITDRGREVLLREQVPDRVGLVSAKVDTLSYRMGFDLDSGQGTVVANITLVDPADISTVVNEIQLVVNQGYAMGKRIAVAEPGTLLGEVLVPEGNLGLATICSVSLNGILQKAGIPVLSRFGGLLEIRERRLVRFVNMIEYHGSTLDPLEIFIRANMTRVRDVVLRGTGIICASFREVPAAALERIKQIRVSLKKVEMDGILAIGLPNQPLFGIPVSGGHCGLVVAGGLNSVAAAREAGVRAHVQSLAGLIDYHDLVGVRETLRRFR